MPRTGTPEADIIAAIEALNNAGETPSIRRVREQLGDTGSFTRISKALQQWREQQTETQQAPAPEVPEAVQQLMQRLWAEAYRTAEASHEAERQALEQARTSFEIQQAELLAEIERLEHEWETAMAKADREAESAEARRRELEQTRAAQLAAQARATTLAEQLDVVRQERVDAAANAEGWIQRALEAEAKLAAQAEAQD